MDSGAKAQSNKILFFFYRRLPVPHLRSRIRRALYLLKISSSNHMIINNSGEIVAVCFSL